MEREINGKGILIGGIVVVIFVLIVYGGLYKLEYNNDTLGEIKKVNNKTVEDYLKTSNMCK